MKNFLESFFLSAYTSKMYVNQQKAKAFMYYSFLMICLLLIFMLIYPILNAKGAPRAIAGAGTISLIIAISILFLRSGNLNGAVMVYLIPTVILVTAARFLNAVHTPYGGFTSYIYYCYYLIVFVAIFGKKYMVPLLTLYFVLANIVFFFFVKGQLSGPVLEIAGTGVANSTPSLFIVGVVSYIHNYLSEKSNNLHKEEAEVNRKQYNLISDLFVSIKSISEKLEKTASSFNNASGQIADGARDQAAILEESSASMEEMAGTIENVSREIAGQSESINTIDRIMEDLNSLINDLAAKAGAIMAESARSISLADNAVNNSAIALDGMRNIQQSSEQIKSITELISEIADQTNLLALNAAIESARAGEAGRGFAVVSDEISKLADKSTQSAKEIEFLIKETSRNINADFHLFNELDINIRKMKETLVTSEAMSREMNDSAQQQLGLSSRVKSSIHEVNVVSGNVAYAMNEQSRTSLALSNSLTDASEITQRNAESSLEVSDMTSELVETTERLLELLNRANDNSSPAKKN